VSIPERDALYLQLAAIAGNEPPSSYLEIRPLNPSGAQEFVPVREQAVAVEQVLALRDHHQVYVGAAPRVRRDGRAAAVERVWCLWADCDGREALGRLCDFRPLPAIVVRSGSEDSAHAYWPLREPLPPLWAQRANRRLALTLGADRASTDAPRILRPIGTLNHKHDPPRLVRCTRLEIEAFSWVEVVGSLPDDRVYVAPPRSAGEHRPVSNPGRQLEGLVRTVAEAKEGNRNSVLHWAACCVRESDIDPAVATSELRLAALHAGLPEPEIERTIASALRKGRP
jgi:hypothetical protein